MTGTRETGGGDDGRADQGGGDAAGRDPAGHRDPTSDGAPRPSGNRRQFLKAASVSPIAAALAGCPLGGSDDGTKSTGRFTPPDLSRGETAAFEATMRFGDRYELNLVQETAGGATSTLEGRFHGDDHYLRVESEDQEVETYVVDGDSYFVTDGQCLRYPEVATLPEGQDEATAVAEDTESYPELTYEGTVSRDGEEFLELVLPANALEGFEEALTYHVSAATYYLRRLETPDAVVEFSAWGDVDPIDLPSMDCPEQA